METDSPASNVSATREIGEQVQALAHKVASEFQKPKREQVWQPVFAEFEAIVKRSFKVADELEQPRETPARPRIEAPANPTVADLIAFYADEHFETKGATVSIPYRATRLALQGIAGDTGDVDRAYELGFMAAVEVFNQADGRGHIAARRTAAEYRAKHRKPQTTPDMPPACPGCGCRVGHMDGCSSLLFGRTQTTGEPR